MAEEEKKIPPYSTSWFQGIGDSREAATIQDFLDDLKKQGYQEDLTVDDFLKFSDGHLTNAEVIINNYSPLMKEKYKSEIEQNKPPLIPIGTWYAIPNKQITAELQEILASDLFMRQYSSFRLSGQINRQNSCPTPNMFLGTRLRTMGNQVVRSLSTTRMRHGSVRQRWVQAMRIKSITFR